jgi:hypothetical protein
MTPGWLTVSYAMTIVIVAAYLVRRAKLRFTARGCFLGSFLAVFGVQHLMYQDVLSPVVYQRITFALILMWGGVIAGMEAVALVVRRKASAADRVARLWASESLPLRSPSDSAVTAAVLLTITFLAATTAFENPLAKLREFITLNGDTNSIAELRGSVGGSKLYVYNVLIASVGPFLSFVTVLRALRRRRASSWVLAAITVTLVGLGRVGLLNRSSLPIYLVQLALVPFVAQGLRIRLRHAIIVIGLGAVFVYPFFFHYLSIGPGEFVGSFFDRAVLAPYYGLPSYFSTFPDEVPFAMGRSVSLINYFFYHERNYIPPMLLFAQKAGNFYGSFNGMFVGEAWADFGFYGVLVESFLLGLSLGIVDIWIFARGKTIEGAAAIVGVMYGVIVLSGTALQTALFSGGIVLVPATCFFLQSLRPPARMASRVGSRMASRPRQTQALSS